MFKKALFTVAALGISFATYAASCTTGDDVKICLEAEASGSDIELTWTVSGGAPQDQQIYRDTDSDPSGRVRIGSVSTVTKKFTDAEADAGVTYYYWIKFKDDGSWYNAGSASAQVSSGGSSSDVGSACTSSKGTVYVDSPIVVSGTFDGGCKTYMPTWGDCAMAEFQDPVFLVNNGTLKNVIVGSRGDGIHVYGNATIQDVTWLEVCGRGLIVKDNATVNIKNITVSRALGRFIGVDAKATVNVSKAKINDVFQVFREHGGKCYPIEVTLKDSELTNVREAIFRTDCSSSTFTMSNTELSDVEAVCKGDGQCFY